MTRLSPTAERATRGLTLIELLAALVLLSVFVPLAGGWLVASAKAASVMTERSEGPSAARRALALLLDDLDAADAETVSLRDGVFSMTTPHPAPGARAAWRRVSWSVNEDAEVMRTSTPLDEQEDDAQTLTIGPGELTITPITRNDDPAPIAYAIDLALDGFAAQSFWEPLP